jgi:hypothetical protein
MLRRALLLRSFRLKLVEVVILDLARQSECPLGNLRFHPHYANSAFERLFQMFSIRIMSWDFDGAD